MITVKNLLKLDSMKGGSIVAGHDFINNKIESINVMDAPDSMLWVKPKELILTTGYPLHKAPESLADLVSMLKEKGCAALGIKMNRYFEIKDSPIVNLANKYGLPIISIPYGSPFSLIISEAMGGMFKNSNEEEIKKILDEALDVEDLDSLISTVSKFLETNVSLESPYIERPICYNKGDYSETLINSIHYEWDNNLNYFSEYYFAKNNKSIPINIYNFIERCIFPVIHKDTTLGLLSIWHENNKTLNKSELLIIDYMLPILKFMLKEDKKKRLVDYEMNLAIGMELLAYKPENKDSLTKVIRYSQLEFKRSFRLMTISGLNLNLYDKSIDDDYNYSYFISKINQTITNNPSIKTLVFFYEGNLITIFYNLNLSNENELEYIIKQMESMLGVSDILVNNNQAEDINIGLSKEYGQIENSYKAYEESLIAIEIGHEKGTIINKYVDIGILSHIYNRDKDKLNNIIEASIKPLLDDKNDSPELFHTLDIYFKNNESLIKTSQELFIHRNTLSYRLNQIKELTGLDINKVDHKLSLYLGLIAYNLMKNTDGDSQQ